MQEQATKQPETIVPFQLTVKQPETADEVGTDVVLDVQSLEVYYGSFRAVKDVDMPVQRRDLDLSRQVVQDDGIIDARRNDIEERCVNLIARQQPMATDLRTIIAILQIVGELERMGDYASGIAKISLAMRNEPPIKPLIDIPRMADKAAHMLRRSLDALVGRDIVAAEGVRADDDEVDALYDQIYHDLLTFMLEDPRTITRATYLLWGAHDLERIADRATNIAKRVIYLVTGEHVKTKNLASAGS